MRCPYCEKELEKGEATFMAIQGFAQMIVSFNSNEESEKGIFKRKTQDKIIFSGDQAETYYCSCCKKNHTGFRTKIITNPCALLKTKAEKNFILFRVHSCFKA